MHPRKRRSTRPKSALNERDQDRLLSLSDKSTERCDRDRLQQRLISNRLPPGGSARKYLRPLVQPIHKHLPKAKDKKGTGNNQKDAVAFSKYRDHPRFEYALDLIRQRQAAETHIVSELNAKPFDEDAYDDQPFDFVYLSFDPIPPCRFRNCYWLQVASEDVVKEQVYFTLSFKGITRISDDLIEFTDLPTWLFEKSVFDRIVQMSCVGRIRAAALFYKWKDYIYGRRFRSARLHFDRHAFHCCPILQKYLIQIQEQCLQIRNTSQLRIWNGYSYSKQEFYEEQEKYISEVRTKLNLFSKGVRLVVLNACHEIGSENGGFERRDFSTWENDRQLRRLRRLTNFVRLADFMLLEALFDSTINTCAALRDSLRVRKDRHDNEQAHFRSCLISAPYPSSLVAGETEEKTGDSSFNEPVLYTRCGVVGETTNIALLPDPHIVELGNSVHKKTDGVLYTFLKVAKGNAAVELVPTQEEWAEMIQSLIRLIVTVNNTVSRVVQNHDIRVLMTTFVSPETRWKYKMSHLRALVYSHEPFSNIMSSIRQTMDSYVSLMENVVASNEPILDLLNADEEHYTALEEKQDVGLFRARIDTWMQKYSRVKQVKERLQIGCFVLDLTPLINALLPEAQQVLQYLSGLLPNLLNIQMQRLIGDLDDTSSDLSKLSSHLDEFVDWLLLVKAVQERHCESESLEARFSDVQSLYEFLVNRNSEAAKGVTELYRLLNTRHDYFIQCTEKIGSNQRTQIAYFYTAFEKRCSEIDEQFQHAVTEFDKRSITDVNDSWEMESEIILSLVQRAEQLSMSEKRLDEVKENFKCASPVDPESKASTAKQMRVLYEVRDTYHKLDSWWASCTDESFIVVDKIQILKGLEGFYEVYARAAETLSSSTNPLMVKYNVALAEIDKDVTLLRALSNKCLLQRHRVKINKLISSRADFDPSREKFRDVLVLLNDEKREKIFHESDIASRETRIRKIMDAKQFMLETTEIKLSKFRHSFVLEGIDIICSQLEDARIALCHAVHKDSPWKEEADSLYTQTVRIAQIMLDWKNLQEKWIKITSVLALHNVRSQDKKQLAEFEKVDENWRRRMRNLKTRPCMLEAVPAKIDYENIKEAIIVCDSVQQDLEEFLLATRKKFPRLFFLSDEELTHLLGNHDKIAIVQESIRKCFQNMKELVVEKVESSTQGSLNSLGLTLDSGSQVTAMRGFHDIVLSFPSPVQQIGSILVWLSRVENEMHLSVKQAIESAYSEDIDDLGNWTSKFFPQALYTAKHMQWCNQLEEILSEGGVTEREKLHLLSDTVQQQCKTLIGLRRSEESALGTVKLEGLITLLLEHDNVMRRFVARDQVNYKENPVYHWQHQLRLFRGSDHEIFAQFSTTKISLGLEFNSLSRVGLIIPRTSKYYFAIANSMISDSCHAVFGESGSGKSSLIQSLGSALMKLSITFSCTRFVPFKTISNFMIGIAQVGAWGSFENALSLGSDILASTAGLIQCINVAIASAGHEFRYKDDVCQINRRNKPGIFFVFSIANKNHPLLQLPSIFRTQFRPQAVIAPLMQEYVQALLYQHGFTDTSVAAKLTCVVSLLHESSPAMRDIIGLRKMKSVIRQAAVIYRSDDFMLALSKEKNAKRKRKGILVAVCYRDSNVIRCALQYAWGDLIKHNQLQNEFSKICDRYFPTAVRLWNEHENLRLAFEIVFNQNNLVQNDHQVKCMEHMFNHLEIQHALLVTGAIGCGKSTCIEILANAVSSVFSAIESATRVRLVTVNPKLYSTAELYGYYDEENRWNKGLLATLIQPGGVNQVFENVPAPCSVDDSIWIHFDAVPDTQSLEALYYVIDDSTDLSLPNGERAITCESLNIIVETCELGHISPGLLTRCGCVHVTQPNDLWILIVQSWVQLRRSWWNTVEGLADVKDIVIDMIRVCGVDYLGQNEQKNGVGFRSVDFSVATTLQLLDAFLSDLNRRSLLLVMNRMGFMCHALVAIVWGFCATSGSERRAKYSRYLEDAILTHDVLLPFVGMEFNVFNIFYKVEYQTFIPWILYDHSTKSQKLLPEEGACETVLDTRTESSSSQGYFPDSLVVLTPITLSLRVIMGLLLENSQSSTVLGPHSCGKSKLIQMLAVKQAANDYPILQLSKQSAASNVLEFMKVLQRNLCSRVFIDDLSLGYPSDRAEVLRLIYSRRGFYLPNDGHYKWTSISSTFVSAIRATSDTVDNETLRCLRLSSTFEMPDLDCATVTDIHVQMMSYYINRGSVPGLANCGKHIQEKLVSACIAMYYILRSQLVVSPTTPHWLLSSSDVTHTLRRILRALTSKLEPATCLKQLCNIWKNESRHSFYERMHVDEDERLLYCTLVSELSHQHFAVTVSPTVIRLEMKHQAMSQSVLGLSSKVGNPTYLQAERIEVVSDVLRIFNQDNPEDTLPISITRKIVDRIIKFTNAIDSQSDLIILSDGTHHLPSLELASYMSGYVFFSCISSNCTFLTLVERALERTAIHDEKVFLVLDDDVDDYLSHIQDLFQRKHPYLIEYGAMRDVVLKTARSWLPLSRDRSDFELREQFMNKVYSNLVICIWIDKRRCDYNKVLHTLQYSMHRCCIEWIPSWNAEELYETSLAFLRDNNFTIDETLEKVCRSIVDIHRISIEQWKIQHQAGTSTVEFNKGIDSCVELFTIVLTHYRNMHSLLNEKLHVQQKRYNVALDNLRTIAKEIGNMQYQLQNIQKDVGMSRSRALVEINAMDALISEHQAIEKDIEKLQHDRNVQATRAQSTEIEIDFEITRLTQLLHSSVEALKAPTQDVRASVEDLGSEFLPLQRLAAGIGILFSCPSDISTFISTVCANDFTEKAQCRAARGLDKTTTAVLFSNSLSKYAADLPLLNRRCKFLYHILNWMLSFGTFQTNVDKLEAKRVQVRLLEKEVEKKDEQLRRKTNRLERLMARKCLLESTIVELNSQADDIESSASRLQSELSDMAPIEAIVQYSEKTWTKRLEEVNDLLSVRQSSVLMTCCEIAYSGKFGEKIRANHRSSWVKAFTNNGLPDPGDRVLISDDPLSLIGMHVAHIWTAKCALPDQPYFLNNAAIVEHSIRCPLLIDPHGIAFLWLQKCFQIGGHKVRTLSAAHGNLDCILSEEVVSNSIVVLTDVCTRHIRMLRKYIVRPRHEKLLTKIGENCYNNRETTATPVFQLYLVAQQTAETYSNEVAEVEGLVNIVDFTGTQATLENIFLDRILSTVNPDKSRHRYELKTARLDLQKSISEIDSDLIRVVESYKSGDDQENILRTFRSVSRNKRTTRSKLATTTNVLWTLEASVPESRELAQKCASIYSIAVRLRHICSFYVWTIDYIQSFVTSCISRGISTGLRFSEDNTLLKSVLRDVCQHLLSGMLEEHRVTFKFLVAAALSSDEGRQAVSSSNDSEDSFTDSEQPSEAEVETIEMAYLFGGYDMLMSNTFQDASEFPIRSFTRKSYSLLETSALQRALKYLEKVTIQQHKLKNHEFGTQAKTVLAPTSGELILLLQNIEESNTREAPKTIRHEESWMSALLIDGPIPSRSRFRTRCMWRDLEALEQHFAVFQGIRNSIKDYEDKWRDCIVELTKRSDIQFNVPPVWRHPSLTMIQRLILIRCLCPGLFGYFVEQQAEKLLQDLNKNKIDMDPSKLSVTMPKQVCRLAAEEKCTSIFARKGRYTPTLFVYRNAVMHPQDALFAIAYSEYFKLIHTSTEELPPSCEDWYHLDLFEVESIESHKDILCKAAKIGYAIAFRVISYSPVLESFLRFILDDLCEVHKHFRCFVLGPEDIIPKLSFSILQCCQKVCLTTSDPVLLPDHEIPEALCINLTGPFGKAARELKCLHQELQIRSILSSIGFAMSYSFSPRELNAGLAQLSTLASTRQVRDDTECVFYHLKNALTESIYGAHMIVEQDCERLRAIVANYIEQMRGDDSIGPAVSPDKSRVVDSILSEASIGELQNCRKLLEKYEFSILIKIRNVLLWKKSIDIYKYFHLIAPNREYVQYRKHRQADQRIQLFTGAVEFLKPPQRPTLPIDNVLRSVLLGEYEAYATIIHSIASKLNTLTHWIDDRITPDAKMEDEMWILTQGIVPMEWIKAYIGNSQYEWSISKWVSVMYQRKHEFLNHLASKEKLKVLPLQLFRNPVDILYRVKANYIQQNAEEASPVRFVLLRGDDESITKRHGNIVYDDRNIPCGVVASGLTLFSGEALPQTFGDGVHTGIIPLGPVQLICMLDTIADCSLASTFVTVPLYHVISTSHYAQQMTGPDALIGTFSMNIPDLSQDQALCSSIALLCPIEQNIDALYQ